ncbi:MAG: carboxylating nicotinate-nucleotide diphosphorylase [Spirochaetota bacterium]|jgi:nicotinate-nucleotide pyrophosphorylase (carboxylating)|nr:carboxylating nicotinate-nucleotide diphosphorylase [Spirochaetota bacterium]
MLPLDAFINEESLAALIRAALAEDVGSGDATTEAIVPPEARARARVIAKGDGVLAGLPVFSRVIRALDASASFYHAKQDGERIFKGNLICRFEGSARALLTGERTALNFLGRLSGIATEAGRLAALVEGKRLQILDTRKTTPLHRALEKYAVQAGGCGNHRRGLYDMVLIKENHIAAAGGIASAVRLAREKNSDLKIEVETTNEREVREALAAGADRIMLDNMNDDMIRDMVRLIAGSAEIEASGNMNAERIRALVDSGVDFISVGAITQSAPAFDFSMLIDV